MVVVISFTLTSRLRRYTGYHNYSYPYLTILMYHYIHADEIGASSGPEIGLHLLFAFLPARDYRTSATPLQNPIPHSGLLSLLLLT